MWWNRLKTDSKWAGNSLHAEHEPKAIRLRLLEKPEHSYLGDAVLGGIDGGVTTFAVVAGAAGAGFPGIVVIVLGLANLVADGFSMAASNYLSAKSQREELEQARLTEILHIEQIPHGEREEIRQIFRKKGFAGEALEKIVEVITGNRELWVNTMLTEELGLQLETRRPWKAALATFGAFLFIGFIPLIPFVLTGLDFPRGFLFSSVMTAMAFSLVGALKGFYLERSLWRSAVETLLIGGGAALMAYAMGSWLRHAFGIN
jgi:vacuolar iron transporter family protein